MSDRIDTQRKLNGRSADSSQSIFTPVNQNSEPLTVPATEVPPDVQCSTNQASEPTAQTTQSQFIGHDFGRIPILPHLSVSQPDDPVEPRPNRVSRVMRSATSGNVSSSIKQFPGHDFSKVSVLPQVQPAIPLFPPEIQRKCAACEEEDEQIMRQVSSTVVQRDETGSLPSVPNYRLTPPSLLQPPDPAARYRLGDNSQLQLDPQVEAMAMQYVQQQVNPSLLQPAFNQIRLGVLAPSRNPAIAQSSTAPNSLSAPAPIPASSPTAPPSESEEPTPTREATLDDLVQAGLQSPMVQHTLNLLSDRVMQDWDRLRTGEQIGVVSALAVVGGGALAAILPNPEARRIVLSPLNGQVVPVPGVNWLSLELNTADDNLMLGLHIDVGRLLPPSFGFGPAEINPIGAPPEPEPLPGQRMIQRKANETGAEENIAQRIESVSGSGSKLDEGVQQHLEQHLRADLSSVRIHTDSEADRLSKSVNAVAFTTGQDIFFRSGSYNPTSTEGQQLIAHEVVHTVQQANGAVAGTPTAGGVSISNPSDPFEQEAEQLAEQIVTSDFKGQALEYPLAVQQTGRTHPDSIAAIQRDEAGTPGSAANPTALAEQIYDALNWSNNEARLFQALQGHEAGMRNQIQQEFQSRHGQSLQSYLREQLDGDSLVRAFALLTSTNYHEQHTAMALALIPLGTRDEEVFRILYGLPEAGRRTLEEKYNEAFSTIGEGSLKLDLKGDLSGWRIEKSLALLHHNLTSAEDLYFDSAGITGTHTDSVVSRIQSEWARGPAAFAQFEHDWDHYVKGAGDWNNHTPWTDMSLAQAMDSELSGEELELVQAVLTGYQQYQSGISVETGPLTEAQQLQRENIELQVAESTLTAATTGGYTGWGTNEPQVFSAVSTIRRIWQQRIERARQTNDTTHLQEYQQAWDQRRRTLLQFIPSEMDEGTADNQRVRLLTVGDLTPADEVYLASQELDNDRVINLVTRYWAQGQIDQLLEQSQTPRTAADGAVLRPTFDVTFTVPVTSGITASRLYTLTRRDKSNVERGVLRLRLEIDEGDSDSDLQRAYQLMSGNEISPALRDGVIQQFAATYLSETEGDTPARKFLTYITNRYQNSTACWNFRDLLDRTADPNELVRRAEGRLAASRTGILDAVLSDYVSDYDALTGEDTQAVTQESLERLRFIASRSRANPDELTAMMAMSGAETPEALASMEYSAFQARLEEVRQLKRTIAEAIATAAELAVEAALTALTGGAAGGAFIASLSAAIAGMLLREAMLGQDYDLVSRQNLQQLVLAGAAPALNAIGSSMLTDIITPERLERLGRAGSFLHGAATDAFTQLNLQVLTAGFEGRAPSAESISASVLSIAGNAVGTGAGRAFSHGATELTPAIVRLRTTVIANISQNVISGVTEEGATLVREGTGDLTGVDIAMRFGNRTAQSIGRGLSSGVGEHAADQVASARRARSEAEATTETPAAPHADETSTPPHSDPASPSPRSGDASPDTPPATGEAAHVTPDAEPPAPRNPDGTAEVSNTAPETGSALASSIKDSGQVESNQLSDRQIRNELEHIRGNPDLIEGSPPNRKAKIGDHEWQEQPGGGWCRHSNGQVCVPGSSSPIGDSRRAQPFTQQDEPPQGYRRQAMTHETLPRDEAGNIAPLPEGVIYELPGGHRVWRVGETVMHDSTLGPGTGQRMGFENELWAAGEHGQPEVAGMHRAHTLGQGTGFESPFGILYAPAEVNLIIQNNGVEEYFRGLQAAVPPGETVHVVTRTSPHPGTHRLKEIRYRVEVDRGGGRREWLFDYVIEVGNDVPNPTVTHGIGDVTHQPELQRYFSPEEVDVPARLRNRFGAQANRVTVAANFEEILPFIGIPIDNITDPANLPSLPAPYEIRRYGGEWRIERRIGCGGRCTDDSLYEPLTVRNGRIELTLGHPT